MKVELHSGHGLATETDHLPKESDMLLGQMVGQRARVQKQVAAGQPFARMRQQAPSADVLGHGMALARHR